MVVVCDARVFDLSWSLEKQLGVLVEEVSGERVVGAII
jgi:hypothetical protein